jgi:lysophospholipase L1-like esterase
MIKAAILPSDVPNLNLWLKADAGLTTVGSFVDTWADQSIFSNNAVQNAVGYRPVLVNNFLNGKPVIRFEAPQKMVFPSVGVKTLFIVYKDNGTIHDYGDLLGSDAFGVTPLHGSTVSSGKLFDSRYVSTTAFASGTARVDSEVQNFDSILVSTSSHIYSFSSNGSSGTFSNIANNQGQSNRFRKGDYAEIIAYSSLLSEQQRYGIETYLSEKYNIAIVNSSSSQLTAGTAFVSSVSTTSISVSSTDPNVGVTYQWYRSNVPNFATTSNELVGATTVDFTDNSAVFGNVYYYKLATTLASSTVITNEIASTPSASSTFSISILADGDSITSYPNNYTTFYKSNIESGLPNVTATTYNVSVSGQSFSQMLGSMPTFRDAYDPNIVTVSTFLNDLSASSSQLTADIISYVNIILSQTDPETGLPPQVVLMTDNFSGQNLAELWARPAATQLATHDIVLAAYQQFSSNPNVSIVDPFAEFYALGVDTPELYAKLLGDKVHPNGEGYSIFDRLLKPVLLKASARLITASTMAPSLSNIAPGGTLSSGSTSTILSLTTDKVSVCKYDTTNVEYASLANTLSTSGGINHSASLNNLADGTSYTYYVRCSDTIGNISSSRAITFSVDVPPVIVDVPISRGMILMMPNVSYTTIPQNPVIIEQEQFNKNLMITNIDLDVMRLQKYLNKIGFTVSEAGAGSSGKETNYFGIKTREALKRLQEVYATEILTPLNLRSGTGIFGPLTRSFVNSMLTR